MLRSQSLRSHRLRFNLRGAFILLTVLCLAGALTVPWWRSVYQSRHQQLVNQALLKAAAQGDVAAARAAIRDGADLAASDEHSRHALYHAVVRRDRDLLQLLLASGADPNQPDASGTLPLTVAVHNDDLNMAQALMEAGATGDDTNVRLIDHCISHQQVSMLELLLGGGMKYGVPKSPQHPPLHGALHAPMPQSTRVRMVKALLKYGADPTLRWNGWAAMDIAAETPNQTIVDLFVEHGAPYTIRDAVALNRLEDIRRMLNSDPTVLVQRFPPQVPGNRTLLGLALEHEHVEAANLLLDAGAPMDAPDTSGKYFPLHWTARKGNVELTRLLLKHGASVDVRDHEGDTPLQHVVSYHRQESGEHDEVVDLLIAAGADVNAQDDAGQPPLQKIGGGWINPKPSEKSRDLRIAQKLMAAGADPAIRSRDGQDAFSYWRSRRRDDILDLLETPPPDGSHLGKEAD